MIRTVGTFSCLQHGASPWSAAPAMRFSNRVTLGAPCRTTVQLVSETSIHCPSTASQKCLPRCMLSLIYGALEHIGCSLCPAGCGSRCMSSRACLAVRSLQKLWPQSNRLQPVPCRVRQQVRQRRRQAQAAQSGVERQHPPQSAGTDGRPAPAQRPAEPHAVRAAQQWEAGMQTEPALPELGRDMDMGYSSSQRSTQG